MCPMATIAHHGHRTPSWPPHPTAIQQDPPPPAPPQHLVFHSPLRSITYNGSMDSPVPLYPTDFPPSYETVMGLRGDSQVGVTAGRGG